MLLPLSSAVAETLDVLDEAGSTNAVLVERARAGTEREFSVVVTTNQTAGRGRLGRTWTAPPGKTIAVSVLLMPPTSEKLGWLPLLAGLAMTRAVRSLVTGHAVTLKWPNDVQVEGLKVSGLLAELVPGAGVVIGAGLNLTMDESELPTPVSTSLTLVGASADDLVDRALAAYLGELKGLYTGMLAGSDIRALVEAECSTIGRSVRVELPGGDNLYGTATGIDGEGRLLVDGRAIAAGDVTHLRYE
ncbi:MAG: Biotin--[acetyl-CoA-carboxylase] ligase [Rhodoglobus sp.]|jgi:BirA family biotin operon repressor/biotin-[acetyl-CoA-carboxylase] ligase|nr:Biotin--[acetyl-CoA-carboxylase] ligase [Rhodoglobus sp.]